MITTNINDIIQIVLKPNNKFILLQGDLGAGKTYLVSQIAKTLNIKKQVTSPTFVIMNKYKIEKNENYKYLIHYDLYRLTDINKQVLEEIQYFDFFYKDKVLIFIEWPERLTQNVKTSENFKDKIPTDDFGIEFLPDKYLKININLKEDQRIYETNK